MLLSVSMDTLIDTRMDTLFVYGTLLSGLRLHHHMSGAVLLGEAFVLGRLYDVGTYPALCIDNSQAVSYPVKGELYSVGPNLIENLDSVEEYYPNALDKSHYIRKPVSLLQSLTIEKIPCKAQWVWAYVFNLSVDGLLEIKSGDYRAHDCSI